MSDEPREEAQPDDQVDQVDQDDDGHEDHGAELRDKLTRNLARIEAMRHQAARDGEHIRDQAREWSDAMEHDIAHWQRQLAAHPEHADEHDLADYERLLHERRTLQRRLRA